MGLGSLYKLKHKHSKYGSHGSYGGYGMHGKMGKLYKYKLAFQLLTMLFGMAQAFFARMRGRSAPNRSSSPFGGHDDWNHHR